MAKNISEKTLQDLEFTTVLEQVAEYSISNLGKEKTLQIQPISNKRKLFFELNLVNEYLSSFENENRVPNHYFEDITEETKRLAIENSFLETEAFLKVATVSDTVNEQKKFLKKFETYYPTLFTLSENIEFTTFVSDSIKKIITSYGEVADNASPVLKQIRKDINSVRGKISESFSRALSRNLTSGYLDDIKETIIDNQRVLAVTAMHRRKVKGSLLGSSKSGSIVYIAPQATLAYSRELQNLVYEEKQEIVKILRALADEIRPYTSLLNEYVDFLTHLDVVASKAKYAHSINGLLPKITKEKKVFLKDAFHPVLWKKNNEQNIKTISQTIRLDEKQQIIVISGPNAGGKSITLKTIGLLQLMLQSGLLIPVHERSETTLFNTILTDIGDNQSIENQLSTYSYRLKNMRYFLKKCNDNTLFLIDEFGTGSDPELGGALAEIFLEEFYENKAFGIITTHYANLKVLANELDNVTNANMQFDERTLEPLYKLFIGQAGSSFTFEVAQKNGIPFSLINRAKKRVETEKVRLDKTISKLQKERNRLQKTSDSLVKQKTKGKEHIESLQEKEQKLQDKLSGFQELYDNNQRMLSLGRKINELLNKYFQTNNKKELSANFFKWVMAEKTKHIKKNPPKKKTKQEKKKDLELVKKQKEIITKVEKEVLQKVVKVREEKKKIAEKVAKEKAAYVFKVNDRVRLTDGNSVGTIDKIEKKNVFINYGLFTTKAKIEQLELVEKAKK
ncbi:MULTISPECIES: endonuclease MutS2 [unclassified Tenacibaculum]|uniref:endonuclease MutS2 n=1 Tax=unclassified Tenacibaculum TaxID=2635139 RepID=UPI001F4922EB|nr:MULTISPECIES: DNA mismatch repair protein MutS [unclassified Tenacibaculum]MCF2873971.1 DNA mismatch repair protein MutS [Tenacibaculum sp. Cn5-1]MCF2934552.1 DNA mismatch repair protein MutS [Tenacibaculum sp. Cn5-34]MCG7510762.1 DNA mismatch repair protein MutS [Tenacibaculum sp. Cn5-46]